MEKWLFAACSLAWAAGVHARDGASLPADHGYKLAVLEYSAPRKVSIPWRSFGQVLTPTAPVSSGSMVSMTSISGLKLFQLVSYLKEQGSVSVVANTSTKPGDSVRAPCGQGVNIDFALSRGEGGPGSGTVRVRTFETGGDASAMGGQEKTPAVDRRPVDDVSTPVVSAVGDTLAFEMSKKNGEGDYQGCVALMSP